MSLLRVWERIFLNHSRALRRQGESRHPDGGTARSRSPGTVLSSGPACQRLPATLVPAGSGADTPKRQREQTRGPARLAGALTAATRVPRKERTRRS